MAVDNKDIWGLVELEVPVEYPSREVQIGTVELWSSTELDTHWSLQLLREPSSPSNG